MNRALFVTRVQAIVGPLLADAGFSIYSFYSPPETSFRKQLDATWFSFIDYQYDEESEILDYREFFINIYRCPEPHNPSMSVLRNSQGEIVRGRIYRKTSPWIPDYLKHILSADRPSESWLYRSDEELDQSLKESLGSVSNILPLLVDLSTQQNDLAPLLYHS
jgi:hypothetical protein